MPARHLAPAPLTPIPFGSVGGALADGAAVANGVESSEIINTSNCKSGRIRFQATAAGSLRLVPVRADAPNTEYTLEAASAASPVAVAANTEVFANLDQLNGEGLVKVGFTPSADGVVTFCDQMMLKNGN